MNGIEDDLGLNFIRMITFTHLTIPSSRILLDRLLSLILTTISSMGRGALTVLSLLVHHVHPTLESQSSGLPLEKHTFYV